MNNNDEKVDDDPNITKPEEKKKLEMRRNFKTRRNPKNLMQEKKLGVIFSATPLKVDGKRWLLTLTGYGTKHRKSSLLCDIRDPLDWKWQLRVLIEDGSEVCSGHWIITNARHLPWKILGVHPEAPEHSYLSSDSRHLKFQGR